ncbi:hypothetical protein MNEG_15560, partial [Monoraphidium neglectum]
MAPMARSLSRLRSVDFYKKIPSDLTEATLTGAWLSVTASIIMSLLLVLVSGPAGHAGPAFSCLWRGEGAASMKMGPRAARPMAAALGRPGSGRPTENGRAGLAGGRLAGGRALLRPKAQAATAAGRQEGVVWADAAPLAASLRRAATVERAGGRELSAFLQVETVSEMVVDRSTSNELLKVTFNI